MAIDVQAPKNKEIMPLEQQKTKVVQEDSDDELVGMGDNDLADLIDDDQIDLDN